MSVQTKRWTRAEYERMAELGLLAPEGHTQLIDGEILEMTPPGPRHATVVGLVQDILRTAFGGTGFHVRTQQPVYIGDDSEPEPDVAVVRGQPLDYLDAHPTGADVVLAVEISARTIDLDRRRKARLYARGGIPEYWIVALRERILEVFTRPGGARYEGHTVLRPSDTVSPVAKPDAVIEVASLLP